MRINYTLSILSFIICPLLESNGEFYTGKLSSAYFKINPISGQRTVHPINLKTLHAFHQDFAFQTSNMPERKLHTHLNKGTTFHIL